MREKFHFQVSKKIQGGGGFPGAVAKALEQFKIQAPYNMRRGDATVLAVVAVPEDGAYFAVVLAGPFSTLDSLQDGLAQAVSREQLVEQMKRVGIE